MSPAGGKQNKNMKKIWNLFLTMTNKDILEGAGTISYEKALEQIVGDSVPSKKIASILFEELKAGE